MSKVYDYKTLIELSVSQKRYFSIPVYGDYYKTLIGTLEKLLDTPLTPPDTVGWSIKNLFNSALELQYLSVEGDYLMGGPTQALYMLWQREGSSQAGQILTTVLPVIGRKEEELREHYLFLAHELFKLFYGEKLEKTVTSEALLAAGFDDSQEPDLSDYYDHL